MQEMRDKVKTEIKNDFQVLGLKNLSNGATIFLDGKTRGDTDAK